MQDHDSKMQSRVAYFLTITILMGDFVKLRATITDPLIPGDGVNPAVPVMCQTCCQGPAAVPGIPGVPGHPGAIGQVGQKGQSGLPGLTGLTGLAGAQGETGESGANGESGKSGNPGPKGDDGMGLPGKIGLRGPPGLVGPTGNIGQKGEQGQAPANHRVAFTVRRSTSTDLSDNSYTTPLLFEDIFTLLPGTSFDEETGVFTCNVPGTYVFMFSANKLSDNELGVYLRKNGIIIVSGFSSTSNDYEQISGSAVVVLREGDTVYLTMYGRVYSFQPYCFASFSGFLLYDE